MMEMPPVPGTPEFVEALGRLTALCRSHGQIIKDLDRLKRNALSLEHLKELLQGEIWQLENRVATWSTDLAVLRAAAEGAAKRAAAEGAKERKATQKGKKR